MKAEGITPMVALKADGHTMSIKRQIGRANESRT
jgi:hypothetical protein